MFCVSAGCSCGFDLCLSFLRGNMWLERILGLFGGGVVEFKGQVEESLRFDYDITKLVYKSQTPFLKY